MLILISAAVATTGPCLLLWATDVHRRRARS